MWRGKHFIRLGHPVFAKGLHELMHNEMIHNAEKPGVCNSNAIAVQHMRCWRRRASCCRVIYRCAIGIE